PRTNQTVAGPGGIRQTPSPISGATLAAGADLSPTLDADALGATLGAVTLDASNTSTKRVNTTGITSTYARTAVLPRTLSTNGKDDPEVGVDGRARFERVRALGEGGMGEVLLAQDHDINRKVALKRLRSDQRTASSLLRFAEEARVIGQ